MWEWNISMVFLNFSDIAILKSIFSRRIYQQLVIILKLFKSMKLINTITTKTWCQVVYKKEKCVTVAAHKMLLGGLLPSKQPM